MNEQTGLEGWTVVSVEVVVMDDDEHNFAVIARTRNCRVFVDLIERGPDSFDNATNLVRGYFGRD